MGSYTDVKNLIISNIKANGQREITGPILQDVLLNMLENSSRVEEITYSDLKALRDGAKLTPSRLYRITDYITTTVQSNTKSVGHPFDVIVLAISESELLEQAWAIQHEGDEYFTNSNLSDWEIWYCLDNDINKFSWADETNGKGVIYRMIDEWNNDVPYDFKNIQFARDWSSIAPDSGLSGTIYCYTFSVFLDGFSEGATADDESIKAKECIETDETGSFGNNVIGTYQNMGVCSLNDIVFITDWSNESINHYSNTFRNNCYSNTFGSDCNSNTFGSGCYSNTFDPGCNYNTFGNNYNSNTFGSDCNYNTFGNNCSYIKFASDSSASTKYHYYRYNRFGDGCQYIVFKGAGTASSTAQVQNYKFAQGLQGTSSNYLPIDAVRNRAFETKVAQNSNGELKIYCEADLIA